MYALIGAAATTGATASPTSFLKTFDGHTFTRPFTLTTRTFTAAVPAMPPFPAGGRNARPRIRLSPPYIPRKVPT
ncbi:hypothetical protein [Streptomyces sp. NBC_00223]|uniref:hypothetical protein n=1 Tax=Streptomyces sp. NBC_00223 TaxID=2976008 RepID=UPI002E2D8612|nr:hypothetical protein [Streptomyces sp. NBC_00223]